MAGVANRMKYTTVLAIANTVATLFCPATVASSVYPIPCQEEIDIPDIRMMKLTK